MNTLHCIIPVPAHAEEHGGKLPISSIRSFSVAEDCPDYAAEMLNRLAQSLMMPWRQAPQGELRVCLDEPLGNEGWAIDVTPEDVLVRGGKTGLRYALEAFTQMLMAAVSEEPKNAALDCGHIQDEPRFQWRGLLLDSSRHFQRPDAVKAVIRLMAHFRLNKLHWHLIDNQGFRLPSRTFPKANSLDTLSGGCYTVAEMQDIEEYALLHDVEIVPELDSPGHFGGFLKLFPEYSCNPEIPSSECCLGNENTLKMIEDIYDEAVNALPKCNYIHVGGDEAVTTSWEKCPKCQEAMRKLNCRNIRHLEHHFVASLMKYSLKLGRTPICWSTPENLIQAYPLEFPKETIIQAWSDLREPIFWAEKGYKVIYSLHTSLYLDYPMNFSETHEPWMFHLDEKGIYICEPFGLWPEKVKDSILGTEACLWTETVPEWRVFQKLMPRLPAYAECSWSKPENKDWYDFSHRSQLLEAAGYFDFIRSN